jgi:hypothetical protein
MGLGVGRPLAKLRANEVDKTKSRSNAGCILERDIWRLVNVDEFVDYTNAVVSSYQPSRHIRELRLPQISVEKVPNIYACTNSWGDVCVGSGVCKL